MNLNELLDKLRAEPEWTGYGIPQWVSEAHNRTRARLLACVEALEIALNPDSSERQIMEPIAAALGEK